MVGKTLSEKRAEAGKRGGKSRSTKKLAALARNREKARAAVACRASVFVLDDGTHLLLVRGKPWQGEWSKDFRDGTLYVSDGTRSWMGPAVGFPDPGEYRLRFVPKNRREGSPVARSRSADVYWCDVGGSLPAAFPYDHDVVGPGEYERHLGVIRRQWKKSGWHPEKEWQHVRNWGIVERAEDDKRLCEHARKEVGEPWAEMVRNWVAMRRDARWNPWGRGWDTVVSYRRAQGLIQEPEEFEV